MMKEKYNAPEIEIVYFNIPLKEHFNVDEKEGYTEGILGFLGKHYGKKNIK